MAIQYQLPSGSFINESGTLEFQATSGGFANESSGTTTQTITCTTGDAVAAGVAATILATSIIVCTVGAAVADGVSATISVVSGTITLTDVEDLRVYQRNGTSASITLSGAYTGAPTAIQARIVEDGTSTEVVTWTTIDAAPAGGTFSGAITVPEGGWYNAQVRQFPGTGTTDEGANQFGVGILCLCIGQSNIAHWFDRGTNTEPTHVVKHSGAAFPATAGTWALLGTTAQGAAAFGNALRAQYGVPIGLLAYGVGGSAINSWDGTADTNYRNALKGAQDCGSAVEYVLWVQGEEDSRLGTAQATYETALGALVTNLRADITNRSTQSNLPVLVSLLGRGAVGNLTSDANGAAIRAAQLARIAALSDVYLGATTHDLDLADGVHYANAEYERHAARLAQTIKFLLGTATYHRGPAIASAQLVDSTHVDVLLTHRGGTDISPASGINGFEVLEAGTPVAVTGAARQSATVVRITLTAPLAGGAVTVRHQYGIDGGVTFANTYTGELVDNSALALPVEGIGTLGTQHVITCSVGSAVADGVAATILAAQVILCSVGEAVADGVPATIGGRGPIVLYSQQSGGWEVFARRRGISRRQAERLARDAADIPASVVAKAAPVIDAAVERASQRRAMRAELAAKAERDTLRRELMAVGVAYKQAYTALVAELVAIQRDEDEALTLLLLAA